MEGNMSDGECPHRDNGPRRDEPQLEAARREGLAMAQTTSRHWVRTFGGTPARPDKKSSEQKTTKKTPGSYKPKVDSTVF